MTKASSPVLIRRYLPEVSDSDARGSRRVMAMLLQRHAVPTAVVRELWKDSLVHNHFHLTGDESTLEPADGLVEGWWFALTFSPDQATLLGEGIIQRLRQFGFDDEDLEAYLACSRIQALENARQFYLRAMARKRA